MQQRKGNHTKRRTVATLAGVLGLEVRICVCLNWACDYYGHPYHPEEEGRIVLPYYEYGLDVLALIGTLRYREHESVPQIHGQLLDRGVRIGERNVTYLIERYDELVALSVDTAARSERLRAQGRAILAIDGLQLDAGQEVLWLIQEVLSREVLLVRGVRQVEWKVEKRDDEVAQITQGNCAAVRAALTDDGQAPLDPGGLKLQERLSAISQSLEEGATRLNKRAHFRSP